MAQRPGVGRRAGSLGSQRLTCSCRWSHMPLTGFRYKPACVATSTCGLGGGQTRSLTLLRHPEESFKGT